MSKKDPELERARELLRKAKNAITYACRGEQLPQDQADEIYVEIAEYLQGADRPDMN